MFNKKNVIQYESDFKINQLKGLESAKNFIPDWYKKIPKWENNQMMSDDGTHFQHTMKQCFPFLDAMSAGYIISLPYDIYVSEVNGQPNISWSVLIDSPPGMRGTTRTPELVPAGHYDFEYTWKFLVAVKVDPAFSFLVTHPLNRHDLPFTTLSGVVDGGFALQPKGNVPFYLKKGFEGMIEHGTPIAQIIPFRREKWNSKEIKGLAEEGTNNNHPYSITNWYKKTFWKKKEYN